jgi:hypothetical protein
MGAIVASLARSAVSRTYAATAAIALSTNTARRVAEKEQVYQKPEKRRLHFSTKIYGCNLAIKISTSGEPVLWRTPKMSFARPTLSP